MMVVVGPKTGADFETLRPLSLHLEVRDHSPTGFAWGYDGSGPAQLALAWCLTNPNVSTVITGASKVSQVTENMKALDVLPKLTPDVLQRLEQILNNKPELVGDFR